MMISLFKAERFFRNNPYLFAICCGVGLGSIWLFNWQVSKQLTYEDEWEDEDDGAYFLAHDTPPDGNCLFSAITLSRRYANGGTPLQGNALHQSAGTLRMAAVGYLKNHGQEKVTPTGKAVTPQGDKKAPKKGADDDEIPIHLLVELNHRETFEGYCKRMMRNGVWGSAAEILALARTFERPISVWICKRDYHDPLKTVVRKVRIPYGRFGFFSPPTITIDLARISVYGQEFLKEGVQDWDIPIMFNDMGSHYLALERNPYVDAPFDAGLAAKSPPLKGIVDVDEVFDPDHSMKGGGVAVGPEGDTTTTATATTSAGR